MLTTQLFTTGVQVEIVGYGTQIHIATILIDYANETNYIVKHMTLPDNKMWSLFVQTDSCILYTNVSKEFLYNLKPWVEIIQNAAIIWARVAACLALSFKL